MRHFTPLTGLLPSQGNHGILGKSGDFMLNQEKSGKKKGFPKIKENQESFMFLAVSFQNGDFSILNSSPI